MKTLIIYGSTYGFAEQCAQSLAGKLSGQTDLVNIQSGDSPNLAVYDQYIIGGSIYMGQIQKRVKEFCLSNLEILKSKKVALFICCGFPENLEQHLRNAFPQDLLDAAAVTECFGGAMNVDKMKFVHKMITKMVSKAVEKEGKGGVQALPRNIDKLAEVMN